MQEKLSREQQDKLASYTSKMQGSNLFIDDELNIFEYMTPTAQNIEIIRRHVIRIQSVESYTLTKFAEDSKEHSRVLGGFIISDDSIDSKLYKCFANTLFNEVMIIENDLYSLTVKMGLLAIYFITIKAMEEKKKNL